MLGADMAIRTLFVTRLYEATIDKPELIEELEDSVRALAAEDRAGRDWSKAHGYRGYTSYASLNDLPSRDPVIGDLVKLLNGHVRQFALFTRLSVTPGLAKGSAPRLGEHTSEILAEAGYSAEEIDLLIASGKAIQAEDVTGRIKSKVSAA